VGVSVGVGVGGRGVSVGVAVTVGVGTSVAICTASFPSIVTCRVVDRIALPLLAVTFNWPVRSKITDDWATPLAVVARSRGSSTESAG